MWKKDEKRGVTKVWINSSRFGHGSGGMKLEMCGTDVPFECGKPGREK